MLEDALSSPESTAADLTAAESPAFPWGKRESRTAQPIGILVRGRSATSPTPPRRALAHHRGAGRALRTRGTPRRRLPAPRGSLHRSRPGTAVRVFADRERAHLAPFYLVMQPGKRLRTHPKPWAGAPMRINGQETKEGLVREGDAVELHNAAVSTSRAVRSTSRFGHSPPRSRSGCRILMVSSARAKRRALRSAYAFAGIDGSPRPSSLGESGSGKELAARSIHGLSERRDRPFIARNAATMPDTLIDAELFGNAKNYPNPGMAERRPVGEADRSTLFLDEIGDLPEKSRRHLLRVLDSNGESISAGEAKTRTSAFARGGDQPRRRLAEALTSSPASSTASTCPACRRTRRPPAHRGSDPPPSLRRTR